MAFSFTRLILENTETPVYQRGLEIANKKIVVVKNIDNNSIEVTIKGTSTYDIKLGFKRTGSPKTICSCPYFLLQKQPCKHIIASSIYWDRSRNVPDPDKETLNLLLIPEPDFTSKDVNQAYRDPLNADLEILRADSVGWSRSHANLPQKPAVCHGKNYTHAAIKNGISELKSWTGKYKYDHYFCAGEMIAGLCELIRWAILHLTRFPRDEVVEVAKILVDAHHAILGKIDDSDGLHEFTEVHLYDLIGKIVKAIPDTKQRKKLNAIKSKIDNY